MNSLIDNLQMSNDYYIIDFIPYEIDNPDFLELEEYFEETYLNLFAEKISRIALKLIYYYTCEIYLTEPSKRIPEADKYEYDTDIRKYTPCMLAEVISKVILSDFSTVQILFSSPQFLISICGDFSVTIYGTSDDDESIKLIQTLVNQEGLFLKRKIE